jgi:nitrite reductase/ring-hydroxylating ferredoxin subunit
MTAPTTCERWLCALEDIPDGRARGLIKKGLDDQVFAVRSGNSVSVWLNDCPHQHRPLEYRQDQFLSSDGGHIVCYAHSAHFHLQTGDCFAGPCLGQSLVRVASEVRNGQVFITADLPSWAATAPAL